MVRAVVDTNVLISSALKGGISRKIWTAFRDGVITLIFSPSMIEELTRVLRKPKFSRIISEDDIKKILLFIELSAEFIEPVIKTKLCRDPCDNHILAAAYSARADFIVTGDKDLLCLNTFHKIKIVTPREFSLIASI